MAHALHLTANLSESFAKPRLSIVQSGEPFPDLLVGLPALLAHTLELLAHALELLPHSNCCPTPPRTELSPHCRSTASNCRSTASKRRPTASNSRRRTRQPSVATDAIARTIVPVTLPACHQSMRSSPIPVPAVAPTKVPADLRGPQRIMANSIGWSEGRVHGRMGLAGLVRHFPAKVADKPPDVSEYGYRDLSVKARTFSTPSLTSASSRPVMLTWPSLRPGRGALS